MTRTAERLSVAKAVASASVSWARRERWRTARPAANSGSTITGIAASTKADSFEAGDRHHRDRADEHEEIAQRDRGGGAEGRLELRRVGGQARGDLAGLFRVEEARIEPRQMGEQVGAQVRDHALAKRRDQVGARPGGERQHGDHAEHAEEIDADEGGVGVREAEVDHPAHRDRHDQRRGRSEKKRDQRGGDPAAIGERVGQDCFQGAERGSGRLRTGVGVSGHCSRSSDLPGALRTMFRPNSRPWAPGLRPIASPGPAAYRPPAKEPPAPPDGSIHLLRSRPRR